MIWVVICFSTFLRLSVQLANLVFAHTLGELLRNRNHSENAKPSNSVPSPTKSNMQIKYESIIQFIKRNGGSVTRSQIMNSKLLSGGAKEYDRLLGRLEKAGKIKVDREKESKQDWIYSLITLG